MQWLQITVIHHCYKNISDELSIMVRKCKKFSVQLYTYINSYFEKFKPKMIFGSKNIFPCSWIC